MKFSTAFDRLENKELRLEIIEKNTGNAEVIPYYYYSIILKTNNVEIGKISVRIGHNKHSYYNGNLGYEINEEYRGNKYSLAAAKLLLEVAKFHKMQYLHVCCNESNIASATIIELLGAKLVEIVKPPEDYAFYHEDMEKQRIYRLDL